VLLQTILKVYNEYIIEVHHNDTIVILLLTVYIKLLKLYNS